MNTGKSASALRGGRRSKNSHKVSQYDNTETVSDNDGETGGDTILVNFKNGKRKDSVAKTTREKGLGKSLSSVNIVSKNGYLFVKNNNK